MNKINVGGHGRRPFCNENFKSANICRTEAGLGQFRTVKIPSETERIKQKKMNYFAISLFSIPLRPLSFGPNYEFE